MAKKKSISSKTLPQEELKSAAKVSEKPKLEVKTLEEAKKLVEESYMQPGKLEYTVLSNGHVFYGINNKNARNVAEKFGLKYFDVKF